MSFCQLHLHTHLGSSLDGIGSSEQYAQKASSLGHKAMAITDHGKMSGVFEHYKSCKKYGIKPIIGVEAYITDNLMSLNEKNKRERTKSYHLNIYAKNVEGYKNLLKLNYFSMKDEEHFYYNNRILLSELIENKNGLIITSGCSNSPINIRIQKGEIEEAKKIFDVLYDEFKEDFYGEIQLNEFSKKNSKEGFQEIINEYILKWSKEKGVKNVLCGDVHYLNKGEDKVQTLSIAIRNKQTINNLTFELESKNLYYHDLKDYIDFNEEFGYNYKKEDIISWCKNTMEVADKVEDDIIKERDRIYLPKITEDDEKELIISSVEGLKRKFNGKVPNEYTKRLKYELDTIIRKGFASYMLLMRDIFTFAKKEKLYYGVGRGSAAGSLVAYSLGVTTIDPIKFGLLFERFVSQSRSPDVCYNYFK